MTAVVHQTLPLTVLVHEGPMARAYLAYLRNVGYRPQRIIQMVLSRDPGSKLRVAPWLPSAWRQRLAERVQVTRLNYWPRYIRDRHAALYARVTETLHHALGIPNEVFAAIVSRSGYKALAVQVDKLLVENLADPLLVRMLSAIGPTAVLYTGGGIVPSSLLKIEGLRFLHVHPGFLPHVRGSDGLLWSTCVHGCPGMSAFYMAAGIDTGQIVLAREFPPLAFPLTAAERPDDLTLYRALFSFCDPVLRAHLLIEALRQGDDPAALPSRDQELGAGVTYHFMHPILRRVALARLFPVLAG